MQLFVYEGTVRKRSSTCPGDGASYLVKNSKVVTMSFTGDEFR